MLATLQVLWFVLIGVLLIGYTILDGFDLGAGFWHLFTKKEEDRRAVMAAVAPVWDGNEVWLLTGGGAIFAAFPAVYAGVFSAFYLALMLVLYGLIFRAVSLEMRNKMESPRWRARWDLAFAVGSVLPALLFGVALGNVVRGLPLDGGGNYTGGFFDLLNPYSLLVGITGLAMFILHGALYLALKTENGLHENSLKWARLSWYAVVALYVITGGLSFALVNMGLPIAAAIAALAALVALVAVRTFVLQSKVKLAFMASAAAMLANWLAVGATLFPNLVPASNDPALSLTIRNASSSELTLLVMAILAVLGMPLVIGYTIYIYKVFRGKVNIGEGY